MTLGWTSIRALGHAEERFRSMMNFDQVASIYPWLERLCAGTTMQHCREAFLEEIPTPSHILLAGEGHGQFLKKIALRFPHAEITVVDASRKMLEIAQRQIDSERVHFLQADLLRETPAGPFDLIVTHFFFDCFTPEEIEVLVKRLGNAAGPRATWLIGDFHIAEKGGASAWRSRIILRMLYTFFRVTTGLKAAEFTSPAPWLENAGFDLVKSATSDWGLFKSGWWKRG